MFGGVFTQALLDIGDVFGAFEIDAAKTERAVHEMDVAIDEAGQDQLACGVDYFGAWLTKFFDGGVVTDGHDFVCADGESLGPGLFGIESVDLAVEHDGVGAVFSSFLEFCAWRRRGVARRKMKKIDRYDSSSAED